jgi:hypothetical protein
MTEQQPWLHRHIRGVIVTLAAIGILPAAFSLLFYFYHFDGGLSVSNQEWSQFGDFVGGTVGPSLSFAALLGLAVTLLSQSISYRQTADSLEEERRSSQRRDFERILFEMLRLYNDIVTNIDLRKLGAQAKSEVIARGRDCFKNFYTTFRQRYKETKRRYEGDPVKEAVAAVDGCPIARSDMPTEPKLIQEAYRIFYDEVQHDVGHCFRFLYRIVKFIDDEMPKENGIISERARTYAGLVRAQLSTYECALLFYNGLSEVGEKFKPLIETYALLGNFSLDVLITPEHESLFDKHAFA